MGLAGNRLSIVFLSVDPQRDTPARLQSYVHYFDPDFTAVTSDDKTLQALGEQLGYVYEKVPDTGNGAGSEEYGMDHSAALMLIDPQGRLDGYLSPPFDIPKLTSDLTRIVQSRPAPRV
jgi:protein SCO1/2